MRVQEWINFLLQTLQHELKKTSVSTYKSIFSIVQRRFGDRELASLTTVELQQFFNELHQTPSQYNRPYSGVTLRAYHHATYLLFEEAVRYKLIEENPMKGVHSPRKRRVEKKRVLTKEELILLSKTFQGEEIQWDIYFMILMYTGKRRGEILALRWTDIDYQRGLLHFRESYNYTSQDGCFISTTKNEKSTQARVPKLLLAYLEVWKRQLQALYQSEGKALSERIFINPSTLELYNPTSVTQRFATIGKRINLKVSPHLIRHTVATHLIANGASLLDVAELLGHSDTSFTAKTYVHRMSMDSVEKNFQRLDRMYNPQKKE